MSSAKKWREENREHINEYKREYNKLHPEKTKAERQKHYSKPENRAKKKQQNSNYYTNNKEKIQAYQYEWERSKPEQKLKKKVAHMVRLALKKIGSSKNGLPVFDYLDYSPEDLKKHIENQFEPWMTWENHGPYLKANWDDNDSKTWTWQIDHIIPQSKLPYDSMEHPNFKKCWALNNLRPLSAKLNVLRKNK